MDWLHKNAYMNIMNLRTTRISGSEVGAMFVFYGVVDRKHKTFSLEQELY